MHPDVGVHGRIVVRVAPPPLSTPSKSTEVRPQKVPITGQGYASTEQHYIYGYKRRDTSYAYLGNK